MVAYPHHFLSFHRVNCTAWEKKSCWVEACPVRDTGNETQYFRERSERFMLGFAHVLLNFIARCLWIYGKATSGLMSLDLAGFNPFTLT